MTPLSNLALFIFSTALLALLFWPRHGYIARGRRSRELGRRVVLEDALKQVYNHDAAGRAPTLESLAGSLEISASRAVALVNRMDEIGLARFADGRIVLTAEGKRYAVDVIRAHRLWERYLADETSVHPVEWHPRAEREEHRMTRAQADALAERLGYPRFDPHGDPIPTADGDVFDDNVAPLTSLEAGARALVAHVEDEPQVVYAQLAALGVCPGMQLRVEAKNEQRIELDADGVRIVLAPLVAQNVSIRRIGSEALPEITATLASLGPGESGDVVRLSPACRGLERRRLMDLGVVPGTRVTLERRGLTGGLSAYKIRDTVIGLREEQARLIGITRAGVARDAQRHAYAPAVTTEESQ
jgi:DtxR family transcriptional regulator, Mn-dependent transcriptional regulator